MNILKSAGHLQRGAAPSDVSEERGMRVLNDKPQEIHDGGLLEDRCFDLHVPRSRTISALISPDVARLLQSLGFQR